MYIKTYCLEKQMFNRTSIRIHTEAEGNVSIQVGIDFTHTLQFLILVSFRIDAGSRTALILQNDPPAFRILTLTSALSPNSTTEISEI
jgi:hypothetical protein